MTITVRQVDARTIGALIALFERAVGFYATLVNINAYHQPGVEAGKKAAAVVLDLQRKVAGAERLARRRRTRSPPRRGLPTRRKPSTCCWNTWRPTGGPR